MRKYILLVLSILGVLIIIGCDKQHPTAEVPNTMRPSIVVDGELFSTTGNSSPIEPDESVIKTVISVISGTEMPLNEGEINFPQPGTKYAKIQGNEEYVVVMIDLEWIQFDKNTDVLP